MSQPASWIADEYGGSYLNNPQQQNRDLAAARDMSILIQRTVQNKGGDYQRTGELINETLDELRGRAPFGFVTPAFALGTTQVLLERANQMSGPQFVQYLEGIKDRDNPLFFWQQATLDPLMDQVKERTRAHVEQVYGKSTFSVFEGMKGQHGPLAYGAGAADAVLNEVGGGARGMILAASNPVEAGRQVIDMGRNLDRIPQAVQQQFVEAQKLIAASGLDDYHKGYLDARTLMIVLDVKDVVETGMSLANLSRKLRNGEVNTIGDAMSALDEGPQVMRRNNSNPTDSPGNPGRAMPQYRALTMREVGDAAVASLPAERQPAYRQALDEALQARGISDPERARKFVADLNGAPDGATMQGIHRRAGELIYGRPPQTVSDIINTVAKSAPDNVEWAYQRAIQRSLRDQGIDTPDGAQRYLQTLGRDPAATQALHQRAYAEVLDNAVKPLPLNAQDYYRRAIDGQARAKGHDTISEVQTYLGNLASAPSGQSMQAVHKRAYDLLVDDTLRGIPANARPSYREALGDILQQRGMDSVSSARGYIDRLNGAPNGQSMQALHNRAYDTMLDNTLRNIPENAQSAYKQTLGQIFRERELTTVSAQQTHIDNLTAAPNGPSMQAVHNRAFGNVVDNAVNALPEAQRPAYRQALREQFTASGVDTVSEAQRYVVDLANSPQTLARLHARADAILNPSRVPPNTSPPDTGTPSAVQGNQNAAVGGSGNSVQTGGNGERKLEPVGGDDREIVPNHRNNGLNGQSVPYTPRFSTQHDLTGEAGGRYTTISGHGVLETDRVIPNIGSSVQRDSFVVPEGVNLHFLGLPGGVITDRLGQRADVGGDLSGVPLLKLGAGDTAPDILITPAFGTINIQGNPITVDNPQGVRLSQLIRDHDLSGNIVVSTCLQQSVSQGNREHWQGITFDLPDRYPKPDPPDLSGIPPRLPIDPNFHSQHGLTSAGDGQYTAIGGNAGLSGTNPNTGKSFAEQSFTVPEGVTVYFPSLPGGSVHNRLAETIEKGEDLSRIPLLKAGSGTTAPDPLLLPGNYQVAGNFLRITDRDGQRLSEVIKEHGLTGNVVVAGGLEGRDRPHSNVLFDLPEQYLQRSAPGGTRGFDLNPEQVVAPRQQTPPQDNRQSSQPAPPQPGDPTFVAYQQSIRAVDQLNASLNLPRSEATEKLVVAAATVAVQQNLRVDEVALNKPTATEPGGTTAFVIEKSGSLEADRVGTVSIRQAMQTPLDEGYRSLAIAAIQPQALAQTLQQTSLLERGQEEQRQAARHIV